MNLDSNKAYRVSRFAILIPLALSAFTHLWNPTGFPNLFYDEGVYMRRAMHVMEGLGPQESSFYDHPLFGQIFLAGILAVIGYPDWFGPSGDLALSELLYGVPRILMGILAVADTFLVFKISERLYNRNVASFASILFAVMPVTWFTRMILLDSILLPFLLLSILLALYPAKSKSKNYVLILISGVSLGLAIFTKVPAFTMIPLVGFLVYSRNNKSLKALALWFLPVVLIPLIWPAQSILANQFEIWIKDVMWQASRENPGLPWLVSIFVLVDPVLFAMGLAGFAYSVIKRDYVVLLWTIPFIVFLSQIGTGSYFHWIPVLPIFTIAAARIVFDIIEKVIKSQYGQKIFAVITIMSFGAFGLASTALLITADVTSAQFESIAYVARYFQENQDDKDMTIISSPVYSWIFSYVFHKDHVLSDYRDLLYRPIPTNSVLLIADPRFKMVIDGEEELLMIYTDTQTIATFDGNVVNYNPSNYPYTSMANNYEGYHIEIRIRK